MIPIQGEIKKRGNSWVFTIPADFVRQGLLVMGRQIAAFEPGYFIRNKRGRPAGKHELELIRNPVFKENPQWDSRYEEDTGIPWKTAKEKNKKPSSSPSEMGPLFNLADCNFSAFSENPSPLTS